MFFNKPFVIDEAAIQPNDVVSRTLATPINPSDVAQILAGITMQFQALV